MLINEKLSQAFQALRMILHGLNIFSSGETIALFSQNISQTASTGKLQSGFKRYFGKNQR
jgi:hypothetical protein